MRLKSYAYLVGLFTTLFSCNNEKSFSTDDQMPAIWSQYEKYKEPTITNRFFKHSEILPLMEGHASNGKFNLEQLGQSAQQRSINKLSIGNGSIKVLLWSQMHGDESTATMALFDLFNFFNASDEFDDFRAELLSKLELHFIPMLNPDGAELWRRRNAFDIDINRDARSLSTPEGKILKAAHKQVKPDFGFNLHDQPRYYTTGTIKEPASISFLAPAYNHENEMNEVRSNGIKLIVGMNHVLQAYAPGKVARYNDAHEPRSFGDNFQAWGTSTILIESGGYPDDPEKQYLRKLNFIVLLQAFWAIANQSFHNESVAEYKSIPENSRYLYDLVIRNVELSREGISFRSNLGINLQQVLNEDFSGVTYRGVIEEVGDMVQHFGYKDVDAKNMAYAPGKLIRMTQSQWDALTKAQELEHLKSSVLFVLLEDGQVSSGALEGRILNLLSTEEAYHAMSQAALGSAASFILLRNDVPAAAVVNGFYVDFNGDSFKILNSRIY